MLVFFPSPYPDELFYSICARYRKWAGVPSHKSILQDLFGKENITASVELPSHLGTLAERLPVCSKLTAERLIWAHTMYPFYSAFLPPQLAKAVFNSMVNGNGSAVYSRAGIMASSIRSNVYFRYCPVCFQEDLEHYGELYWHRLHQIPGLDVCVKHETLLNNSKVSIRQENKHVFTEPTEENCPLDQVTFLTDSKLLHHYCRISNSIERLLNERFPNRPLEWFQNQYLRKLQQRGYASVNGGKVDQERLRQDFVEYYGNEILERFQSSIYERNNWLLAITRKHRKSFHPIRHLLFMNFLNISLEEIFYQEESYKPFGDGPWLCLNPAADHYLKEVVTELTLTTCEKSKDPIGTFSCSCGFVYARRAGENDPRKISKVKHYGELWEEECKRLADTGVSLREIGRRLHADPKTIKKYLQKTRVEQETKEKVEKSKQRTLDRMEWLLLQELHPKLSKTELRKLNPALYTRLYRNDRRWLNKKSPTPKTGTAATGRVNWEERDQEVLRRVQEAVNQILSFEGKPIRLSLSRIGAISGLRALLEKHLNKMPQTKAYLDQVIEGEKDYRLRKIKWAIQELEQEGEVLMEWKVLRKAGIRKEHSPFK